MERIRWVVTLIASAVSIASGVSSVWVVKRNRKLVQRAAEDAYTEGVRYGLAQRKHEWYAGYKQGLREGRRTCARD